MSLECEKCPAVYPDELAATWGQTAESNGMGSVARCIALVENPRAPRPRNSDGQLTDERPLEICGGSLRRSAAPVTDERRTLNPIRPGRTL